ncbi:hypothetical protein [Natrinema versiforme]|uniref:DUF8119 domain-containing protein n=1 Tax=Natrinema versiforme JCM 10478 TaxID=1227496 RepID=L9Y8F2_9EURY|nr:hypothetical protein [Natrinema versiforme]ELY70339.1 hypothetical protein C489_02646 [Natrinema versiforme JCM 10478]
MSSDTARSRDPGRDRSTVSVAVRGLLRLLGDLLAVSLWVLFLTLLFLETAWPRWVFYALLILGVAIYVTVTAAWIGSDEDGTGET